MNIDYTELKEEIEEVINRKFTDVADVIGDILFEIENNLLENKLAEVMKIRFIINNYAEDADNIIAQSQIIATKKIKSLFLKLENDIGKLDLGFIKNDKCLADK